VIVNVVYIASVLYHPLNLSLQQVNKGKISGEKLNLVAFLTLMLPGVSIALFPLVCYCSIPSSFFLSCLVFPFHKSFFFLPTYFFFLSPSVPKPITCIQSNSLMNKILKYSMCVNEFQKTEILIPPVTTSIGKKITKFREMLLQYQS
jgi:hypothetical protein